MTASQIAEWMAYDNLEPFGEYRSELRHGQSMAMTANMNRDSKERPEPYGAMDFMNYIERPAEKKLSLEEVNSIFQGFFGASNAGH